jgi:lysophospholipase L1-like esterase
MRLALSLALLLPLALAAPTTNCSTDNDDNTNANGQALGHWIGVLGVAMAPHTELASRNFYPTSPSGIYNGTNVIFNDTTIRQTYRISRAAEQLRLRVSNVYGTSPLEITAMTIATAASPGAGAVDAGSIQNVTFQGNSSASIPARADYLSDPVKIGVAQGGEVAISTYLANGHDSNISYHQFASNTGFYTKGNAVLAVDFTSPDVANDTSSYLIADIDAWLPRSTAVIVCIGDSITDGYASTIDTNGRYPDRLSERLNNDTTIGKYAVSNQGIGGNRVLTPGGLFGDALLARLDRDVSALVGVTHAVLLEGINDLSFWRDAGEPLDPGAVIMGYQQFITRMHIHGVAAIGATVTPATAPTYSNVSNTGTPDVEAARQVLNDWIRTPGHFDYVVDFDKAIRNESYPNQIQDAYVDQMDWLHPNNAGYQAMADAFDLTVFDKLKGKIDNYN